MSEEEKTEELPKIDKKLMKEALQEILNDIPAFRVFNTKRGEDDRGQFKNGDSDPWALRCAVERWKW